MRLALDDGLEDVFCDARDDALELVRVDIGTLDGRELPWQRQGRRMDHHGECLSTACLAVREDSAVVAVEDIWGKVQRAAEMGESARDP